MAFKKSSSGSTVSDSPEKLFLDLPRRKIPDVMPHQSKIMHRYALEATDTPDVALQLPTGSGKTLVGLLIAEWRKRKFQERVVYLCPTRQLVNQVVEQAEDKYGLTVLGFTGKTKDYNPSDKAKYKNGDNIAITTYSSLFNTNPFFDNADVLIFDDAHVAENYVASLWNLEIDRITHAPLHTALLNILKPIVGPINATRLAGQVDSINDAAWVDKISTPKFAEIKNEIAEIIDTHAKGSDLSYVWSMLRDNLHGCHLYMTCQQILIRPFIPPTWSHLPFTAPKQRIYMSATLGSGGDLERLMGRSKITRLQIPDGWDRQGVGRRFFIFPGMSLDGNEEISLRKKLMAKAGRSLVLVPSDSSGEAIEDDINNLNGFKVFNAGDIEKSKEPFLEEKKAVAIIANRYDGIDFPGNECRLLFIEGLPKAMNSQERFLMSRMGATILFNERIQTRVLQAIGRCTRSLEDYSAVVVSGQEMPDYLADIRRRKYFHPELQAEIKFGVEQSTSMKIKDLIENFETFLDNGEAWEEVNEMIVNYRKQAKKEEFPALESLNAVVSDEIKFQTALWSGDFEIALSAAEAVLSNLSDPELRGYRALWHYLAGSAGWLGAENGLEGYKAKARMHFTQAKNAATSIPWLINLAQFQAGSPDKAKKTKDTILQVEKLETLLADLGTLHERKFSAREKEILTGLKTSDSFEEAHKLLGEFLGFTAGKVESRGSPDPWWLSGDICFIFEDHAGAKKDSLLDVTKARQAASHPKWIKNNVAGAKNAKILPVLVTPVTKAEKEALIHLEEVSVWPLNDFLKWAQNAVGIVRQLRRKFSEPGDLAWRAEAVETLEENGLDAESILEMLADREAKHYLKSVG
jgi:hypothetical protein